MKIEKSKGETTNGKKKKTSSIIQVLKNLTLMKKKFDEKKLTVQHTWCKRYVARSHVRTSEIDFLHKTDRQLYKHSNRLKKEEKNI